MFSSNELKALNGAFPEERVVYFKPGRQPRVVHPTIERRMMEQVADDGSISVGSIQIVFHVCAADFPGASNSDTWKLGTEKLITKRVFPDGSGMLEVHILKA